MSQISTLLFPRRKYFKEIARFSAIFIFAICINPLLAQNNLCVDNPPDGLMVTPTMTDSECFKDGDNGCFILTIDDNDDGSTYTQVSFFLFQGCGNSVANIEFYDMASTAGSCNFIMATDANGFVTIDLTGVTLPLQYQVCVPGGSNANIKDIMFLEEGDTDCDVSASTSVDFACLANTVDLTLVGLNGDPDNSYTFTYDVIFDDNVGNIVDATASTGAGSNMATVMDITFLTSGTIFVKSVSSANCDDVTLDPAKELRVEILNLDVINDLEPTICGEDIESNGVFSVDLSDGTFFTDGTNEADHGDNYTVYYYNSFIDFDIDNPANNSLNPVQDLTLENDGSTDFSYYVVGFYFDSETENRCFRTQTIDFTVENIEISASDFIICEGDEVNILVESSVFAPGADDIDLYDNETDAMNDTEANQIAETLTFNTPGVFTFWVHAENDNECEDVSSFQVFVLDTPQANGGSESICAGDAIDLLTLASISNSIVTDYSPLNGNLLPVLTIHEDQNDANSGADPLVAVANEINVTPANSRSYFVRAEISLGNVICFTTAEIEITVDPLPQGSISLSEMTICDGENSFLQFNPTVGSFPFTLDIDGLGNDINAANTVFWTLTPQWYSLGENTYTLTSIDDGTCENDAVNQSVTLTVIDVPEVTAEDFTACDQDQVDLNNYYEVDYTPLDAETPNITFYDSETNAEAGGATGLLSASQVVSPSNNSFWVRAAVTIDNVTCFTVDEINVTVRPLPEIEFSIEDDIICDGDNAILEQTLTIGSYPVAVTIPGLNGGNPISFADANATYTITPDDYDTTPESVDGDGREEFVFTFTSMTDNIGGYV